MRAGETPEAILVGLLMSGGSFEDVVREVHPSDFVDPKIRQVFETIGALSREGLPTDAVTVSERLPREWFAEVIGLTEETTQAQRHEILHYARMVQRGARRRSIRDALEKAQARIDDGEDIDEIAEEAAQQLDAVFQHHERTPGWGKILNIAATSIQEANKLQMERGFVGDSFTLPELDTRLGGLFEAMLAVLCARTSVGKSTLAWQIALEAAQRGAPVGIIDTEMGPSRLGRRVMSYFYKLNSTRLRLGHESEVNALLDQTVSNPLHNLPLHIDCDSRDIYSIMGQIGRWRRQHGIHFAMVDYLQEVEVPGAKSRFEAISTATGELKQLALRLNMPIILVSQLNRGVEKESRPPMLSDLRESGDIEQDADLVIALHGKLEADAMGCRELSIHILKAKDARTGKVPMRYELHGPTYTISEVGNL